MNHLLPILLLAVSVSGCRELSKQREKTINLTQKEFMAIYHNGYVKGMLNGILKAKLKDVWPSDSAEISKRFFE